MTHAKKDMLNIEHVLLKIWEYVLMPTVYHPLKGGTKFRVSEQYLGHGIAYDFDDVDSGDTVVVSATGGRVVRSVPWDGVSDEGNYVVILGDDGYYYWYLHLERPSSLSVGQRVEVGTEIGLMGSTGNSSGKHLHFQATRSLNYWDQVPVTFYSGDNNGNGELDWNDHNGLDGHLVSDNPGVDGGSESGNSNPPPVEETSPPVPNSEPFNPRSIFFSPIAEIHGSTDGRNELIFRRDDGMVTNIITHPNGRSWRHRGVGHADSRHTLLGGGNIEGGSTSQDELIFRTDNNTLARFTMDERGVAKSWREFASIGQDDVVVGIDNIDRDSYDDILLFNPKSGGISAIMMHKGRARWQSVGTVGLDQRFVGAADFNGDGRHDNLLFANADGEIHQMHLDINGVGTSWSKVGEYNANLQLVGPWNADGSGDDILFRDTETGHFGVFDMDPNTQKVKRFEWVGHANPDQEVVGVGDGTNIYAGEEIWLRHAGSGDINVFGSNGIIFDEHYRYGNATMGHTTMGLQGSELLHQQY